MSSEVPKVDTHRADPATGERARETPVPAPADKPRLSLKDRISDLTGAAKESAARAGLVDRVKAVQEAAPAAEDIRNRIRDAASAVRHARLNRDTLKAGRDGLASKVEALLKARPADPDVVAPPPQTQPITPPLAASTAVEDAPKSTATGPAQGVPGTMGRLATIRSRLAARGMATPVPAFSAQSSQGPAAVANEPTLAGVAVVEPDMPVTVAANRLKTTRIVALEAEAERSRPIFSLGLLGTALTAGGVLHVLTTFAVPWFNVGSAFDRMRWQLEPNVMRVFPADQNGQTPLPFLTADMRYAMCRYDLTTNPVQVSATLPDLGWSLALYTPQGDNFYAVPGQEGRTVTAQFTLNTASDRLFLPQPGVRRSDTDATQVTSPQREGLLVLRAPNLGPAQQALVEEALKRASCRPSTRR